LLGAKRRTTTRIKPTPGEKACGFLALRGLSAAPLGVHSNHGRMVSMNWLNPKLSFREDRPFLEIIRAYAAQLHGHRELISRGIGWRLGVLSTQDVEAVLNLLVPESPQADESLYQKFTDGIRAIHAGGPTPLLLKQKLVLRPSLFDFMERIDFAIGNPARRT
jgi:hypothetical protein